MSQTQEPTSAETDPITTSDQKTEIKDQSEILSISSADQNVDAPVVTTTGWSEEALPAGEEIPEKLVVGGGEVKEVSEDFVELMNQPTSEQNPKERVPKASDSEKAISQDFFDRDQEWKATTLGELPTGQTLQIMKHPKHSGYYLAYREGLNKVPKEIEGWWTHYDKAEQSGRNYLNRLWDEQSASTSDS